VQQERHATQYTSELQGRHEGRVCEGNERVQDKKVYRARECKGQESVRGMRGGKQGTRECNQARKGHKAAPVQRQRMRRAEPAQAAHCAPTLLPCSLHPPRLQLPHFSARPLPGTPLPLVSLVPRGMMP